MISPYHTGSNSPIDHNLYNGPQAGQPLVKVEYSNSPIDHNLYNGLQACQPLVKVEHWPSPPLSDIRSESIMTSHGQQAGQPLVKVEHWPSPPLSDFPSESIMTSHPTLQNHAMYSSYNQWDGDWKDSKVTLSDQLEGMYRTAASYVPCTSYCLENEHPTATAEHTTTYAADSFAQRRITIDNIDDSTRAAILDALCKSKKQVTLVLD
jgi:hypothetical protein